MQLIISMPKLSILIPARNEEFLKRTVEDILSNIEDDTEIIVILDGYETELPSNPKLKVIHNKESIGQRAATNQACKLSNAKYIMKVDAHCAFDKGFDRKMIAEMQDNWTMVPVMRNLHAFNWVCPDGHTRYQSPSGPCRECGKPTQKDVVWIAKTNPQSVSYCFDSEPHFQYFNAYKKNPEYKNSLKTTNLTETMSIQGSCFMMTRDKYWELNVSDEVFGSWGSQGIEVACKTWLSGGRVVVNHKTWYAHMFRTQGGDFGFPYPQSGNQVERAKRMAKDFFFNNKWALQIYPLSSILEKFWPVGGWTDESFKNLKENELKTERSGIYSIKNKVSGKVYVGSATNLAKRFGEHRDMLCEKKHPNKYLQPAWSRYKEHNFTFNIEYFCKEDNLLAQEKRFIKIYKEKIGWRNMYSIVPEAGKIPVQNGPVSSEKEDTLPVMPKEKEVTAGIVYYTDNRLDEKIMKKCQEQMKKSGLPIVSVSLKPIDFGDNIVLPLKRSPLSMVKQILAGLEKIQTDVVFLGEHDVLYHPTHFDFRPPKKDVYYYNANVWQLRASDGHAVYFDCKKLSQLCADRKFLIEHFKKRVFLVEMNGFSRKMGFEPGSHNRLEKVDDFGSDVWRSEFPNVDIKHGKNLSEARWHQSDFRSQKSCQNWQEADEIQGWGKGSEII